MVINGLDNNLSLKSVFINKPLVNAGGFLLNLFYIG